MYASTGRVRNSRRSAWKTKMASCEMRKRYGADRFSVSVGAGPFGLFVVLSTGKGSAYYLLWWQYNSRLAVRW